VSLDLPPSPPPLVAPSAGPWIAAQRPWGQPQWRAAHDAFVARAARGDLDVIFLGDSITERFPTHGAQTWTREIAPLGTVADFGISGDRTQFILWRAQHGELAGSGARVVVLMAGTNNLASATSAEVARGVTAIVATVRQQLPDAIVLLCAILPRGLPDDPLRAQLADVNARIAQLADGDAVRWVDAGGAFVDGDGRIPSELMPDGLHPAEAGYERWAAVLRPALEDALSSRPRMTRSSGRSSQR
jgi:beta-glucosidase